MNCPEAENRLSYGIRHYWPMFSERIACSRGAFYHCRGLQANKRLLEAVHALSVVCPNVSFGAVSVETVQCNTAWLANLLRFFHVILPLVQRFASLYCIV